MKRMIDSEVSERIKYSHDENDESHISIEADNVDIPFLAVGGSGIYSDGQVSAPNIVTDEMSTRVADSINFANAIKATGGFTPIHTYKLDGVTTLYVYFEHMQYGDYIGYGWIMNIGTSRPCIFHYSLQDGKVTRFRGLSDDIIYEYSNNAIKTSTIANDSECQAKLYRHKLTLNGIYVLMYNSTSNLNVGSVADLRTIMKISESNEEILPVCASDATSMVTLVVTTSSCQVDGTDVTSVSDTVTAL